MEVWLVTIIFVGALILLVSEKIPVDLTSIGIMAVLMLTGILTPAEAVAGFANPAVVTVAAMYIVSRGLVRTGAVGYAGRKIIELSKGNGNRTILLMVIIVACSSAFINNTAVVVLFIPIVLSLSCEFGFSPSTCLIPVSYASILAGTSTLIGTSTNIIVSDLSASYGYGDLKMFELAPLGVPIAAAGILFLTVSARRLLPEHVAPTCERREQQNRKYLAEVRIPENSPLIGAEPEEVLREMYPDMDLLEIIRYNRIIYLHGRKLKLKEGDLLFIKAPADDLVQILNSGAAELPNPKTSEGSPHNLVLAELIVTPESSLRDQTLPESVLSGEPEISILAVKRHGLHYTEKRLENLVLKNGDIVLIQCPEKQLDAVHHMTEAIVIEDIQQQIVYRNKAWRAVLIFLGLVVAAATGLADIMVCAISSVALMLLTGCLQIRETYRALQGDVLLLIVGTIALGSAMEKTGTAAAYANYFLTLFRGLEPRYVLAGILLLTSIGTHVLSNNATAVLVMPIAISTALSLGVAPKPFIIAVCFGASACFASPIGYQTNLMVYGPGGYEFQDYFRLGIPLNLIVLTLAALFIPVIWPL